MCGDGKQSYRSQGYEPRPATELWEQSPMNKDHILTIRRAPGTCCPEPSCDYQWHDKVECKMCGDAEAKAAVRV